MILKDKCQIDKDERETIIRLSSDNLARIYSTDKTILNRITKLSDEYPDDVSLLSDDEYGAYFIVPGSWIKIKPPVVRNLSDEAKAKARERLQKAREKRLNKEEN